MNDFNTTWYWFISVDTLKGIQYRYPALFGQLIKDLAFAVFPLL